MVLQVEVGLVLRVGDQIQWRHECEPTQFICLCLFHSNLLAHVVHILLNLHVLRNQYDTAMMRIPVSIYL